MSSNAVAILQTAKDAARSLDKQARGLLFNIWRQFNRHPVSEKPVFIIGCPRSGTSVTADLFTAHPHVANWSEAGEIWDPDTYYDPQANHHWDASMVTKEDAARLHAWFEYYRQPRGKQRFMNKHPRNSVRIGYIDRVFPDAFFIHVIRDGRAVVNSIVNKIQKDPFRQEIPFGNFCKPPQWREFLRDDPVEQAALQWREIVRFILDQRENLENRYYELRYEDLCRDPRGTLASVFSFVELLATEETMASLPQSLKNMNFKYRGQLSTEQIDAINEVQGTLLRELGYRV
jgi:hypothetical protein